jgi:Protein of unknown function (DUF3168)
MATPTTLLGALVAHFQADASLTAAVSGGIWVSQIPEGVQLPFVCLLHGGEVPDWTFERDYVEDGQVQFVAYALGCANAESIATLIKAAFDWTDLTIANAISIQVERTNYQVSVTDLFRAPSGEIVYQAATDYHTRIKKVY